MKVKGLNLPQSLKSEINAEKVREAIRKIAETEVENDPSYHYTFYCPEEWFEKAK